MDSKLDKLEQFAELLERERRADSKTHALCHVTYKMSTCTVQIGNNYTLFVCSAGLACNNLYSTNCAAAFLLLLSRFGCRRFCIFSPTYLLLLLLRPPNYCQPPTMSTEDKLIHTRTTFRKLVRSTGGSTTEVIQLLTSKLASMRSLFDSLPNSSGERLIYWCREIDLLSEELDDAKKRVDYRRKYSPGLRSVNYSGAVGHDQNLRRPGLVNYSRAVGSGQKNRPMPYLTKTEAFKRKQEGRCFTCRERGHRWFECPNKEDKEDDKDKQEPQDEPKEAKHPKIKYD